MPEGEAHQTWFGSRPGLGVERVGDACAGAPGTWNLGTELLWPRAVRSPRSAQPTSGVNFSPCSFSHGSLSSAANSTYGRPHCRAHSSSGCSPSRRSQPAEPCQSCQASSKESRTPRRRCMGESTRNMPPKDQCAWPPRLASFSCSSTGGRRGGSAEPVPLGAGGADQLEPIPHGGILIGRRNHGSDALTASAERSSGRARGA